MQQRLEPSERLPIGKDDPRDRRTVDCAGIVEDARTEAVEERGPDLRVLSQQLVDDVVARDRRSTVTRERPQRLGLACSDSARDRDRYGPHVVTPRLRLSANPGPRPRNPPGPAHRALVRLPRCSRRPALGLRRPCRQVPRRRLRRLGSRRLRRPRPWALPLRRPERPGLLRSRRPATGPRTPSENPSPETPLPTGRGPASPRSAPRRRHAPRRRRPRPASARATAGGARRLLR